VAAVGVSHQQHITRVQRVFDHALGVQAHAQFGHQQGVQTLCNFQALAGVHGSLAPLFVSVMRVVFFAHPLPN
jgi:hypothetical protein